MSTTSYQIKQPNYLLNPSRSHSKPVKQQSVAGDYFKSRLQICRSTLERFALTEMLRICQWDLDQLNKEGLKRHF